MTPPQLAVIVPAAGVERSCVVRELKIVEFARHPDAGLVSFTVRIGDGDGVTTIASFARAGTESLSDAQLRRLIEQRVAELMEIPAPSGRIHHPAV